MPDDERDRTAAADVECADEAAELDDEAEPDRDEPGLLDTVPLPWLLVSLSAAVRSLSEG